MVYDTKVTIVNGVYQPIVFLGFKNQQTYRQREPNVVLEGLCLEINDLTSICPGNLLQATEHCFLGLVKLDFPGMPKMHLGNQKANYS